MAKKTARKTVKSSEKAAKSNKMAKDAEQPAKGGRSASGVDRDILNLAARSLQQIRRQIDKRKQSLDRDLSKILGERVLKKAEEIRLSLQRLTKKKNKKSKE